MNKYNQAAVQDLAKMQAEAALGAAYNSGLCPGTQVRVTVTSQIVNMADTIERLEAVLNGLEDRLSPVLDYTQTETAEKFIDTAVWNNHVSALGYLRDKMERMIWRVNQISEMLTV